VRDTGCGIPEENLAKILDPFFTTKPVGQGTGLGLSIVRQIIDEHGGRLDVHSEEGIGSEFVISLPLIREPVREAA
jgi:signal transduction histidine kinase